MMASLDSVSWKVEVVVLISSFVTVNQTSVNLTWTREERRAKGVICFQIQDVRARKESATSSAKRRESASRQTKMQSPVKRGWTVIPYRADAQKESGNALGVDAFPCIRYVTALMTAKRRTRPAVMRMQAATFFLITADLVRLVAVRSAVT